MDNLAEKGQTGGTSSKTKRIVFILAYIVTIVCVGTLSVSTFVGNRPLTVIWSNSHDYLSDLIQAENVNSSVYPGDFLIISNIRSEALVSTWYDDKQSDIYCNNLAQYIQGHKSHMKVVKVDKAGNVFVHIVLYDMTGERKKHGGDVIFVWAERKADINNTQNDGRMAGCVVDHLNGTYTARLKMLWSGITYIKAKVVAKSGISCLRLRAKKKYGTSVFAKKGPYGIHVNFIKGNVSEQTRCLPTEQIPGYNASCNFTMFNYGLSWFCGHPKQPSLKCSDFSKYITHKYDKFNIIQNLPKQELSDAPIIENLQSPLKITFLSNSSSEKHRCLCRARSALSSWVARYPTGYFWKGHWRETNCLNTVINKEGARRCLAGKLVLFIGDSTTGQYMKDLNTLINASRPRDLDINFLHTNHEMPLQTAYWYNLSNFDSTANQLHKLADDVSISGSKLIIVFTYHAHMQIYSASVYRSRIVKAVAAVKYILYKKPDVRVFFKGPHFAFQDRSLFDARVTLMFRDVIFEEFMDVRDRVVYLDTLSISIAHASVLLHPEGSTLRSQTEQFLSYIC